MSSIPPAAEANGGTPPTTATAPEPPAAPARTGARSAGRVAGGAGRASTGPGSGARRAALGRTVAVLVLMPLAALVLAFGPFAALHGTGEAAAPGTAGISVLRAVLFAALCVPAGEALALRLAHRVPGAPAGREPRGLAGYAALAGCVAALGLASVVSTGNLVPQRLSDVNLGGLYRSRDGVLALAEVNAFLVAGLCARSREALSRAGPAIAVIMAEALRAHPTEEPTELLGSALTAVHLMCAVLWAGGLWQVLRTVRRWRGAAPRAGAALLGRYARVATVLLATVTATGVCSALRRMPPGSVLGQLVTTAYGRTLLAKVVLVTAVAALALAARLRLRRPDTGDPLGACSPARAEVILLGAVVVVSAVLTAVPVPPRW